MERKIPKKVDRKRFVRYKEGAEMYSMCQSKFEDMAKAYGKDGKTTVRRADDT